MSRRQQTPAILIPDLRYEAIKLVDIGQDNQSDVIGRDHINGWVQNQAFPGRDDARVWTDAESGGGRRFSTRARDFGIPGIVGPAVITGAADKSGRYGPVPQDLIERFGLSIEPPGPGLGF
jgi:hypothetical protein